MVYFKTNWIKDSNQWMIRKVRPWFLLVAVGGFVYHFTIHEMLARRVAFFNKYIDPRTPQEKQNDSNLYRSRFGYKPRYEPSLPISIKKEKYANQSLKEMVEDTPRLESNVERKNYGVFDKYHNLESPEITRKFALALLEHARAPGTFDYTIPVTYHAVFPDVEQEAYVTLNSKERDSNRFNIGKYV